MSQLIERLREAHDNFAGLEGVSNDDLVAVLDAAAALTQPSSPVAAEGYVLVPVKDAEDARDLLMLYGSNSAWRELSERFGKALSARPSIGETVPGAGWQPVGYITQSSITALKAGKVGGYIYPANVLSPDPGVPVYLASTQEGEAP